MDGAIILRMGIYMASGIDIYSQLLISTILIADISYVITDQQFLISLI